MNFKSLDPSNPIPLYAQIKNNILEYIESNDLQPNSPLPSEREIAENFQVSRLTVRKAIENLIQEGVAFRLPGKGTFVNIPKIEQPLLVLKSFTEAIKQEGHTPGTKLLDYEITKATKNVCNQLNLPFGSESTKVRRLRFVDNNPFSLATSYIPLKYSSEFTHENLQSESLYSLLEKLNGITLAKTNMQIDVAIADPYNALLLNIKPGSPLFYLHGTVKDQKNEVIEYFEVFYRGDRLRFSTESK